jgi:uncharacterized protein YaiE (UPF0345 family)
MGLFFARRAGKPRPARTPLRRGLAPALKSWVSLFLSTRATMTTEKIDGVSVTTKASVYFDGKCVSHGITFPDGTKKSVGVILPATLTFNTGAPEIMEGVGGSCEYKLDGTDTWVKSGAGEQFSVPGNSKFDIRVTEAYHYICHFG